MEIPHEIDKKLSISAKTIPCAIFLSHGKALLAAAGGLVLSLLEGARAPKEAFCSDHTSYDARGCVPQLSGSVYA